MKTTMYGVVSFMVSVFTLVAVMTITNFNTRSNNLEDNLQEAMEASLRTARSTKGYDINSSEELIADVIQGVILYLGENSALDVNIRAADISAGIISLELIQYYTNTNGETTPIKTEKTIILEEYTDKFVVNYRLGDDAYYKVYTLTSGGTLPIPVSPSLPGKNFLGWKPEGEDVILSSSQVEGLPVDQDYTFYAVFE